MRGRVSYSKPLHRRKRIFCNDLTCTLDQMKENVYCNLLRLKYLKCRRRDSTYPKFLKSLISGDISLDTHENRGFFAFCPVCPVEPISAFYGQDGQELKMPSKLTIP
jgi:hypothetical protein